MQQKQDTTPFEIMPHAFDVRGAIHGWQILRLFDVDNTKNKLFMQIIQAQKYLC